MGGNRREERGQGMQDEEEGMKVACVWDESEVRPNGSNAVLPQCLPEAGLLGLGCTCLIACPLD